MSGKNRYTLQFIFASIVLVIGVLMLIAGFIVPPTGVIDGSVLTAFGEVCSFVGAVWGIETNSARKVYEIDKKYNEKLGADSKQ